ncbi:unnamed protein product [Mytilus coruscus]|uniref:Uncharacterized protein n=1 Tax=Mytilus coruscus TaxID=42192 RepID=A0A6J8A2N7_MYTCO|nr:unnamed protein product [Mytilus coruscus]
MSSGSIVKNTDCNLWRYQPFKFWSHELSQCLFQKSSCNELGQIMFNNSSASNDNVCRCDHIQGYAFLHIPKNHCYCIPTQEDCTCYKKMSSIDHELRSELRTIYQDNEDRMEINDEKKKTQHINAVIRIGLSHSEIAFSVLDPHSKNKEPFVIIWDSKERGILEYNSTAILFQPNKTIHSIGFEAEEYFYSEEMHNDREHWFFFTNIMTTLCQKEEIIDENVKIEDIHNRNKLKAVDVIFAFINKMKLQLLSKLHQDSSDTINEIDTLMIILPAVWKVKKKLLIMLKASELAGDSDYNIILEAPEALIRFYSTHTDVLKENTRCIVLDIGDTSIISTLMTIKGQTYAIETTVFRQYGSISEEFFAFLTRVFTDRVTQYVKGNHPHQYTKTFRNFQVQLKNVRRDENVNFVIPYIWFQKFNSLYGTAISESIERHDLSSDISITKHTAKISYNKFQQFIQHRYQKVATILTTESVSDVKVLFLVGDNIDNMFVTNLREKHPNYTIYSEDPKSALLKGALVYVNQ